MCTVGCLKLETENPFFSRGSAAARRLYHGNKL